MFLPGSGPIALDIARQEGSNASLGGYVLVDIDERVAGITSSQPRDSFKHVFRDVGPAPDLRIGVSDSVVVTIWEAAAGRRFLAPLNDRATAAGPPGPTVPRQALRPDWSHKVPSSRPRYSVGKRPGGVAG